MDIIAMSPRTSWPHLADVAVDTAIGCVIADIINSLVSLRFVRFARFKAKYGPPRGGLRIYLISLIQIGAMTAPVEFA
jgi:hypothetical protein